MFKLITGTAYNWDYEPSKVVINSIFIYTLTCTLIG
jgi:hypothetical protein